MEASAEEFDSTWQQMLLGTANLTVEMAAGSQLSATVSEWDL
jgi:hypothetical protein